MLPVHAEIAAENISELADKFQTHLRQHGVAVGSLFLFKGHPSAAPKNTRSIHADFLAPLGYKRQIENALQAIRSL